MSFEWLKFKQHGVAILHRALGRRSAKSHTMKIALPSPPLYKWGFGAKAYALRL